MDLTTEPSIRRILVIRWSALGDIAIASAAFQDLYEAFPRAEIHLNTMPPWESLFDGDERFARVISIEMRRPGRRLAGVREWLAVVRRGRYDLIVDLQSNDRSRLLIGALQLTGGGARHRIGTRPGWPYSIHPGGPITRHAFVRQRDALHRAGIPAQTPRARLHVPPARRQAVKHLMADSGLSAAPFALFMPGSQAGGKLKRWGARRFIELAHELVHSGRVEAVVLAGAADDADECRRIQDACGPWLVNLCGRTAVPDLVPLAQAAAFVVSNDTGTAHVAAAADRPMVVVCGPTDPARVAPPGDNVQALQAAIHCAGCYRKTCTHHACMSLVSARDVLQRLQAEPVH